MKSVKLLSRLTLIVLLSLSSIRSIIAQNKISLSAGLGIPELLNFGIRGQFKQKVVGISFGIAPQTYSVCGDLFCHYGKVSVLSSRSVWYVRSGLNYLSSKTEDYKYEDRYIYLNLRFGRDLNLSKKIGIQIDAGVIINLSQKRISEPTWHPARGSGDWTSPGAPIVLPSIGLNIFLQL
jgi:hypothetical protein